MHNDILKFPTLFSCEPGLANIADDGTGSGWVLTEAFGIIPGQTHIQNLGDTTFPFWNFILATNLCLLDWYKLLSFTSSLCYGEAESIRVETGCC